MKPLAEMTIWELQELLGKVQTELQLRCVGGPGGYYMRWNPNTSRMELHDPLKDQSA